MAIADPSLRRTARIILLASVASLASNGAWAAFTICNQMLDIANVAIGEGTTEAAPTGAPNDAPANGADETAGAQADQGERIETRGWWVIAPNRCADVIPDKLKNRYIYVHAVDVRGRVLLAGDERFCTLPRQFRIEGASECWKRGFTTGTFALVDTQDAQSWTLFLKEPDRGAPQ